jgi:hypothetical protein
MPKVPSSLYDHSSRNATARQLNISTNTSGRASYSYTSSQIPVVPVAPQPHHDQEIFIPDAMDIDEDSTPEDVMEEDETVEVMPGINVHIVPPKEKRYENSVGSFGCHIPIITDSTTVGRPFKDLGKVPRRVSG